MKDRSRKKSASKSTGEKGSRVRKSGGVLRVATRPVRLRHLDSPPRITKPKRIHARRLLPFVAEGQERPFHSLNTRAVIHRADDAGLDIQVVLNTPLPQPASNRTSSNVNEPSVAINGDVVFFTGNWYGSVSVDGGKTFKFIDPFSMAQPDDPQGVTFCCDQVVNYLPTIDTFVWLMQYGPSTGGNIQRLAFARTDDVRVGKWRIFDITTQMLGVPGFFLDFPDLAVGANYLYMTTNCFGPDPQTVGSAVVRISLDSIAQGTPALEKFVSMQHFSFRVAQNCGQTAYFAAHKDTSTLAVFSWPEGQAAPAPHEVPVARWIGTSGYISRTPDGRRWLDRADPRMTGATLAGTELWFCWSVDADSNHRPKPFVQMARIKVPDMSLIEDVNLFDADSAICYGALSSNVDNEIGVSYMIGGSVFPSHVVGLMTGNRRSMITGKGDRSPVPDDQGHFDWGDFLTVRPVFPDCKLFAATGYSFLGNQDGGNLDATPRLVVFGATASGAGAGEAGDGGTVPETPDALRPRIAKGGGRGGRGGAGAGNAGGAGGGGGVAGPGPVTDVNQLKTVSSAVALQVKTACGVHRGVQAAPPPPLAAPQKVTKPGTERWPVKTGQDPDRNAVGKNVINGQNLGAGIVPATVEELISMPRPPGLEVMTADPPQFQSKRAGTAEITIWQVEGSITVLNQEADGDYHLVFNGASGVTLVAEVPTPTTAFIGDSPWLKNIQEARQAVDDKLIHNLNPNDFVLPPGGRKLVPKNSLSGDFPAAPMAALKLPESFRTPKENEQVEMPTFQTAVKPTAARITGVGFFDRAHGATGAAPNVIELHPVLKIEWM
jgi:hypothetical protein